MIADLNDDGSGFAEDWRNRLRADAEAGRLANLTLEGVRQKLRDDLQTAYRERLEAGDTLGGALEYLKRATACACAMIETYENKGTRH